MKHEGNFEGRELQPRAARVDTRYDALVRLDWGTVDAEIMNVSSRGFRLRTRKELEVGTEVTLEVPRLEPVARNAAACSPSRWRFSRPGKSNPRSTLQRLRF
jgi:hypothetical protein